MVSSRSGNMTRRKEEEKTKGIDNKRSGTRSE
jgi:hypothetical protein